MRRLSLFLLILIIPLAGCLGPETIRPDRMTFEPLEFRVPQVERRELSNGIVLYLKEDHELPLVRVTALVGAGSIGDPEEKTGMGGLFAATLRTGGAGNLSPDAFDEALETLAADISVSTDTYATTLDLSILSGDLPAGMSMLADLLRRPAFDAGRLETVRKQSIEGIRRQNDHPASIAHRLFRKALYGDHPLGRTPTVESVTAVERDDLVDFHRRYFHPNNLRLAISGDFDIPELLALLDARLGDWPKGDFIPQEIPPVDAAPPAILYVAPKDLPQTTILLGEIGIDKSNPDLYAVRVMNYILGGGGFNSRLMREIRSDRGLAYSVYSYYQVGRRLPGPFVAGCETKSASTMEVVRLMTDLMEGMREKSVSNEDLSLAKESIVNSFIFAFEDSHDVVSQKMSLDYYGYPDDYFETYRAKVSAVTREDVLKVAGEYLHPGAQSIILVGNPDDFDAPPEGLGLPVKIESLQE